ncbi:DNA primase family protein [Arthrobacter castelli]|uniref:DNA primase family protein n=1 Tax=Arthrobacter castelli TaxID=271431 RepID=UPI00040E19FB|nr:phage/plasmid primase, P4 family [Arthrobacter castelli]
MTLDSTDDSTTETPGTAENAAGEKDQDTFLSDILDYFEQRSSAAASPSLITAEVTTGYLACLDPADPPHPQFLEQQLLVARNAVVEAENKKISQSKDKLARSNYLTLWQVARILLRLHRVIRIAPNAKDTDREYDLLAMYRPGGAGYGTYTTSEDDIRTTARLYYMLLSLNDFKEIQAILREDSPRRHQCAHPDLIAANNGIVFYGTKDTDIDFVGKTFHFKAKQVHPFDPAIIFLSKNHVDYVADAPRQVITDPVDHSDWEVVEWVNSLSDDEGMPALLWEVIGAIIRPHVPWNKTAWFYSEQGNNGKGTLCALMRNLVGPGAHTSIPLSDFGKDFALEPLVRANAIIVDENDVGTFIDKAANLKAVVTGDIIQINRKYRTPIAYQFFGFMVQCLNEFPRVKDKSESFYRRQLFVPFTKWFGGNEKKHIKNDYLQRKAVLEYVFWYAINVAGAAEPGNYYQLSEPAATKAVLNEYKEANDPVRGFWEEFSTRFAWDLLPFPFLYDHYKVWFAAVSPSGSPVSRQQFVTDLVSIIAEDENWHCPDKNRKIRPGSMMNTPEPLIGEYELKNWYSPTYQGSDPLRLAQPMLKANYRGLLRATPTTTAAPAGDTDKQD